MTQSDLAAVAPSVSLLPGAAVVARIRRLVVAALIAGVGYATFAAASRAYCPGGFSADGGFVDAAGDPTDVAPQCISVTLRPSPLVLIAIAVIVVWALHAVLRRAADEASALRILDRATLIVAIVAVASLVISQVWFALIPITEWFDTGVLVFPFPFGLVDMVVGPMTAS